jgi:hypothetical protein
MFCLVSEAERTQTFDFNLVEHDFGTANSAQNAVA